MELSPFPLDHSDLLRVDERLWVLTTPTGVANYDFRFDAFFRCRRPWQPPDGVLAVARLGALPRYETVYEALRQDGITLVHTPEQYQRATELPCWYPLIEDLTPRSV